MPVHNFYMPPVECTSNDTAVDKCMKDFKSCVNTTTKCSVSMSTCVSAKLRCFEAVTATATQCNAWSQALNNEKLYLAAGGDYNGSSLELSCRQAICAFKKDFPAQPCNDSDFASVCMDNIVDNTQAPVTTPPSSIPPAGATIVTFTIAGNKTALTKWLAKDAGKAKEIVGRIIAKMLGVDASKIVITSITIGSLVVDFYTTDSTLDVATVKDKLTAAKGNADQAQYFSELAADAGMSVSDLSVGEFTVDTATAAPVTETPAPTTAGTPAPAAASGVVSAVAAAVAILALLF